MKKFSYTIVLFLLPILLLAQNTEEDWGWLQTEGHHHEIKYYPEEIDYEEYDSHPNYRVIYDYVFNDKGELVYTITEPSYPKIYDDYIQSFEKDKCCLVKTVLLDEFNANRYNIKSSPKETLSKIKQTIISLENGTSKSNFYENSMQSRYVRQLFHDNLSLFAEPLKRERTGNNTFLYSFGDEDTLRYQIAYTFVNDGAYKAKYNVKIQRLNPPIVFEETNNIQNSPSSKQEETITIAEKMPSFRGDINNWIVQHLIYPAEAAENGKQGKVLVKFVVKKDGTVSDAKVVKSIYPALDKEAIRLVESMPKWNPGMQGGKPVDVWFTVPVSFRLAY